MPLLPDLGDDGLSLGRAGLDLALVRSRVATDLVHRLGQVRHQLPS